MKVNGHSGPEDIAKAALQVDHMAAHEAYMRQQNGIPEPKPEPAQKQPTERALTLARLLGDPAECDRAMNLIDPYGAKRAQMKRRR